MNHRSIHDKPQLLMLSHCIPDAAGGSDRARAWQLLRLVSHTHSVRLACVMDGPVNLNQWRIIQGLTHRTTIERHQAHRRLIGHLLRPFNRDAAKKLALDTPLLAPADRGATAEHFDAVLCTHPALWRQARGMATRIEVCDLPTPANASARSSEGSLLAVRADRHPRRSSRSTNLKSIFVTSQPQDRYDFAGTPGQSILLPVAVDVSFFTHRRPRQLPPGKTPVGLDVVLHGDWNERASRHWLAWFQRRVWPAIQQAVPDARLRDTRPKTDDPATTLLQAAIVVIPAADPGTAHLSILQAMASQRAVVASEHAVERARLGVCHDEHLILAQHRRDWAEYCIGLLRSADARQRLSCNAREFMERYPTIEQVGHKLIDQLTIPDDLYQPISRAA